MVKQMRRKKTIFSNMYNRKAYSIGFTWIFGLVTLFGLGILYITFTQVFEVHLVPTIKAMSNSSSPLGYVDNATSILVGEKIDKYMDYFHLMPYILFFLVIVYMIIASIQKERGSETY